MNYASLRAEIGRWMNRPEIDQAIPAFVALTEADLNRRLAEAGVAGAQGRATSTVEAEWGAAPADLARVLRMKIGGRRATWVTAEGLEALKAANPEGTGRPTCFAAIGGQFRYYPIPDGPYGAELTYQKTLAPLSEANPSNWLIAAHPDAYLFGSLARACEYLGEEARAARWSAAYDRVLAEAVSAERARSGGGLCAGYRPDLPLARSAGGGFNPNPDL